MASDSNNTPLPTDRNPISGQPLDGGTDLSITEILALPEKERDELAKRMGVVCWQPFTVKAICTPADAYNHVIREPLPLPEPIPDEETEEEDLVAVAKVASESKPHQPTARGEATKEKKP